MSEPRIILLDLETLPIEKMLFKHIQQLSNYPGITLKSTLNSIINCGWKVYGENKTHCINAWDFKSWVKDVNDDREICDAIKEVLSDADAIVTYNGKRFDWKVLQTRFLFNDIVPLHKIPHIDCCNIAKGNLYAINNRLNTIAELTTGEQKQKHDGWEMWEKVRDRDPKAMRDMERYCKRDVDVLEGVFKKLMPIITQIPNFNYFKRRDISGDKDMCPRCGSTRQIKNGTRITRSGPQQRFRCNDCGGISCKIKDKELKP